MKTKLLKLALCAMALLPMGAWADFDPTKSYVWDFTTAVSSADKTNIEAAISASTDGWSLEGNTAGRYKHTASSADGTHTLVANGQTVEKTQGLIFQMTNSNIPIRIYSGNSLELTRNYIKVIIPNAKKDFVIRVYVKAASTNYLTTENLSNTTNFGSAPGSAVVCEGTVSADGDVTLSTAEQANLTISKIEYLTPIDACLYSENRDNTITAGSDLTITIGRTLTKDVWNSICLPMAFTKAQFESFAGSGAQLAEYTSVSGTAESTQLGFTIRDLSSYTTVAGRPYLIKPTQDCTVITLTGNVANDNKSQKRTITDVGDFTFTRVYSPVVLETTDYYFASGDQIKQGNGSSKLKAFRGYIKFEAASSSAPRLEFTIDNSNGILTAIDRIEGLDIVVEAPVYNLNGQMVGRTTDNLSKGLYIVNGKKYLVK